jgi:predicted RNA-binding protein YlxR (DUF448 family)
MQPAAQNHDPALSEPDSEIETDAGPARGGKAARAPGRESGRDSGREPERRCIATLQRQPQGRMIRFVLSPDGEATPDLAARLPGRGAWVTASREALDLAVRKGAFSRAFKTQAKAPAGLPDQVETLLARRVLDMLGLAKRSGDLILGFEQVREWIRAERPGCLIEASDGAADGRSKLLGLLKAAHAADEAGPGFVDVAGLVAGCFSAGELGMALGRERVIHACLKQGRFADAWMGELARLSGFRRLWPAEWRFVDAGPADAGHRPLEDDVDRSADGDADDGTES